MRWALILSGMGAAAMLALGFNMVLPLGGLADTVCDLAGLASAVVFRGVRGDQRRFRFRDERREPRNLGAASLLTPTSVLRGPDLGFLTYRTRVTICSFATGTT